MCFIAGCGVVERICEFVAAEDDGQLIFLDIIRSHVAVIYRPKSLFRSETSFRSSSNSTAFFDVAAIDSDTRTGAVGTGDGEEVEGLGEDGGD